MNSSDILKMPLKICVLNPDYTNSNSPLKGTDPPSDPRHYLPKDLPWTWHMAFIDKAQAHQQIQQLRKQKFDLFMNFCDGATDEDRAGEEVVRHLDYFNLPYVGCNHKFYTLSKKHMKVISTSADIKTPKCVFVHNLDFDLNLAIKRIGKYPMIVKHYNGYSSVGLTKKSKVYNDEELKEQCALMIDEFGGALVEEFIEGKEYTVLIIENPENYEDPIVLNPIQFLFKSGDTFKYFDLKNVNWQDMDTALVDETELKQKLMKMAKQAFVVNSGSAYGRMDVRVDDKGEIYFLEINAVPKIFCPPDEMGSADFILKHEPNYNAEKMIYHLINIAFKTFEKKQLPYHVFFRDLYGGLGLFAKREIKKGEQVFTEEEKPIHVVSKSHANKAFQGIRAIWFENYAYPISDTMFAIWSDNPDDWKPINHSCEPNLWYENNTMVSYANRDIKKGEELTLDYATFLIDTGLAFDCACGEKTCRKRFTSKDYLLPEVLAKYNGHFSPYIQDKVDKLAKSS